MIKATNNFLKDKINNNKFLTKQNIKIVILSLFLILLYVVIDVIFISGDYDIKLYTTGIHGIGDAIAKILININSNLKNNPTFNGNFAGIFYGLANLLLFIFIVCPKLDFKFGMNTLIMSIAFIIFLFIFTSSINNNGILKHFKYCFGLTSKGDGFGISLLRVIIVSIASGLILSFLIKIGSSSGGIDIIAKYLSIYKKKDISLYINLLNYYIAFFSVSFLYIYRYINCEEIEWKTELVSLLLTFIKLFINSYIIYLVLNKYNTKFNKNKNLILNDIK